MIEHLYLQNYAGDGDDEDEEMADEEDEDDEDLGDEYVATCYFI